MSANDKTRTHIIIQFSLDTNEDTTNCSLNDTVYISIVNVQFSKGKVFLCRKNDYRVEFNTLQAISFSCVDLQCKVVIFAPMVHRLLWTGKHCAR